MQKETPHPVGKLWRLKKGRRDKEEERKIYRISR